MTLRALPLAPDGGLGAVLAAGIRAARRFSELIEASDALRLHVRPQLDIVSYCPVTQERTTSAVDAASARLLEAGMGAQSDSVFLSTLRLDADAFVAAHRDHRADSEGVRVLRSVLMKPEHETAVEWLHGRVAALASA